MMNQSKNPLSLILKGMAMGIAEVIPGVSGGTIAFITGIYEQLIDAIKKVLSPEVFGLLKSSTRTSSWQTLHGSFVLYLLSGMVIGIGIGIFGIAHLLENYPEWVWAFFFGLIVASVIFLFRQVRSWDLSKALTLILSAAGAYWITVVQPAQGNEALWFVFVAGMIAISALILPGISGSFILLLLGMYQFILHDNLKEGLLENQDPQALLTIFVFGLGCLTGLGTFSRVLGWMFRTWHDLTMALLTGLMLGSLNKVWPWRNVLEYRENSEGLPVPFIEESVLPQAYDKDPMVAGAVLAALIGLSLVFVIEYAGKKAQKTKSA